MAVSIRAPELRTWQHECMKYRQRNPLGQFGVAEVVECKIPTCNNPASARDLCKSHYNKWRLYGDPEFRGRYHIDPRVKVDPEDAYLLEESNWSLTKHYNTFYARRSVRTGPETWKREYLHHAIMGRPERPLHVDHVDGDGLNNRRSNLRVATASQNQANQRGPKPGKRFKGVFAVNLPGRKPWKANIVVNRQKISLGAFDDEVEAALAYDEAARQYFGEFAHPNFPEGV